MYQNTITDMLRRNQGQNVTLVDMNAVMGMHTVNCCAQVLFFPAPFSQAPTFFIDQARVSVKRARQPSLACQGNENFGYSRVGV